MLVKTRLSLLILGSIMTWPCFGLEVSGTLELLRGKHALRTDQGQLWTVRGAQEEVQDQLAKLSAGDYLIAVGTVTKKKAFVVSEIQFVGLKRFLGFWTDDNNSIVEVRSFRELHIHHAGASIGGTKPDKVIYNLAPEAGPGWSLLMLFDQRAWAGRLQLIGDNVYVEFPPSENQPLTHMLRRYRPR